jgi:hypothetical protein
MNAQATIVRPDEMNVAETAATVAACLLAGDLAVIPS